MIDLPVTFKAFLNEVCIMRPFIFLLICSSLSAQRYPEARPFFFGFGATYPWGGVITCGTYNQNGWGGTLYINGMWYKAKNRPSDYEGGGLWGSNSNSIYDNSIIIAVRAMKQISTNSKALKFGIEAGPAWIRTSTADHFAPVTGWQLFSSNYTYERVIDNSIGLTLRGKIEWPATQLTGFELGINATKAEAKSYFGIDLIVTAGSYK